MDTTIDVLTFDDPCVDAIVEIGDLPIEFGQRERLAPGYAITMGGSCSIFAAQTARLGLRTTTIGRVGDDVMGRLLIDAHRDAGISIDHLKPDPGISTSVSFILSRPDDRAILTAGDSISALTGDDIDWRLLDQTRHLHIGSFFLLDGLRHHWPRIISRVKGNGGTVSLDINWDPQEHWDGVIALLPHIDLFFPNDAEAMAITGTDSSDRAARALLEYLPSVIIKHGADGASLYEGGHHVNEPARTDRPFKDAVGAGDSFAGGFVYGYLRGLPMPECLRIASVCGSRNTTEVGGTRGQPDITLLERILSATVDADGLT